MARGDELVGKRHRVEQRQTVGEHDAGSHGHVGDYSIIVSVRGTNALRSVKKG